MNKKQRILLIAICSLIVTAFVMSMNLAAKIDEALASESTPEVEQTTVADDLAASPAQNETVNDNTSIENEAALLIEGEEASRNAAESDNIQNDEDADEQNISGFVESPLTDFIVNAIAIAFVVGITILLLYLLQKGFKKYSIKEENGIPKERKTMMRVISSIVRFAILIIAAVIILSILGVNVSGAVTALGIAGACGALAVQDVLKDLIQGINIVTGKYYAIGDNLDVNGEFYKVLEITMRNTKLLWLKDNSSIVTMGNRLVESATKLPADYMMDLSVPLSYNADVDLVDETLKKAADRIEALPAVVSCIYKGTAAFQDSSINYLVRVYCSPEDSYEMRRQSLRIIFDEVIKAGLSIPFPQMDVHYDN